MFGPSIFTVQPAEVLAGQSRPGAGWGTSPAEDRRRRSIYIHIKRSLGVPILSTNDSADTDNPCPVRFITTQPTQALGMMNSEFTNRQARIFAEEVAAQHDEGAEQVAEVLSRVMQRQPADDEIQRGLDLIKSFKSEQSVTSRQAFEYFCLMAINLNEFVYVD